MSTSAPSIIMTKAPIYINVGNNVESIRLMHHYSMGRITLKVPLEMLPTCQ